MLPNLPNTKSRRRAFNNRDENALEIARIPQLRPYELGGCNASWSPEIGIFENENFFILDVELPGIDPTTVDLKIEDTTVTIQSGAAIDQNQTGTVRFTRFVSLPAKIVQDMMDTFYQNGVLTLLLPKSNPSPLQSIQIEFGN